MINKFSIRKEKKKKNELTEWLDEPLLGNIALQPSVVCAAIVAPGSVLGEFL